MPGADPEVDAARALWPEIEAFLQQDRHDQSTAEQAWARLGALVDRLTAMGVAR